MGDGQQEYQGRSPIDIEQPLDMQLSAYNYDLPEGRIAQNPVVPRDRSRLLVVDSTTTHDHRIFRDLPDLLRPGDLLVMNNTRVLPARLYGHKPEGAKIEVLLLEEQDSNCWLALVKPGRRLKPGATIQFSKPGIGIADSLSDPQSSSSAQSSLFPIEAVVKDSDPETGGRYLQFLLPAGYSLLQVIDQLGEVPLPPYLQDSQADPEQYQTVYGDRPGAAAAPTAGLHFTPELLQKLQDVGIEQAFITLHVGVGTFRPVEVEKITSHTMHGEWIDVSPETVAKIQHTQRQGGRIIAVGTTVVRALEGAAQSGTLMPYCGKTNLFIYPGYQWQVVEGLITNFHLPKSSLMMLVSALMGRERLLSLYQEAIAQQYRFYSFGDAMLILPEARITPPDA